VWGGGKEKLNFLCPLEINVFTEVNSKTTDIVFETSEF
jgi:hypothetical protein